MPVSNLDIHDLKTKKRFQNALPALTADAFDILEQSLTSEGWRSHESIVVWKEQGCIVDGHNRYRLCRKHKIPFRYSEVSFEDEDAAERWLLKNQLGRRSFVNQEQFTYYLGRVYNLEKKPQGGTGANQYTEKEQSYQNDNSAPSNGEDQAGQKTAEVVAEAQGVSPIKVLRSGVYAESLDKLAENVGGEIKEEVLSGKRKLTKKEVIQIADLPDGEQKKVLEMDKSTRAAYFKRLAHPEAKDAPALEDLPNEDLVSAVQQSDSLFDGFDAKWPMPRRVRRMSPEGLKAAKEALAALKARIGTYFYQVSAEIVRRKEKEKASA